MSSARYVLVPKLAHFGNQILPNMSFWYANFGDKPKMAQNALSVLQSDPHTISTNFGISFLPILD